MSTGRSDCEESACNAGDLGFISGLRKFPGGGHGNPLRYCLENPHGQRILAGYTFYGGRKELDTTEHEHWDTSLPSPQVASLLNKITFRFHDK